ncbi:MAG: cyclic pyranopterin monophosphate synthase MoaC [Planctomycetes bacterium]|nr:cyclic pyranopterin monophosphate synthase MoaC [Planctomycetota bacterium]
MNGSSHLDETGAARMVDVGPKSPTVRRAVARAFVGCSPEALEAIGAGTGPKGEVLATARVAAIQAAKRTSEAVPLCHPLRLDQVRVDFHRSPDGLEVVCEARATERTGVEMEALHGALVAALTVYDMAKSLDRAMVIGPCWLESKSGGASGAWRHPSPPRPATP